MLLVALTHLLLICNLFSAFFESWANKDIEGAMGIIFISLLFYISVYTSLKSGIATYKKDYVEKKDNPVGYWLRMWSQFALFLAITLANIVLVFCSAK